MKSYNITDFHSHILPGADHGSNSRRVTAEQLRILYGAGVRKVVATPHFYPQRDSVESFLERRDGAVKKLLELGDIQRPEICLGAEVLVCEGIDHMPDLEKLCIKGTDVILLEMPFSSWREGHIESVRRIIEAGYTVVMAHIDRYSDENIGWLSGECKVLYQVNGEAASTFKGRRKLRRIVECLSVAAVGSDIHGPDKGYAKNLVRLTKKLGDDFFDITDTTEALLRGADII